MSVRACVCVCVLACVQAAKLSHTRASELPSLYAFATINNQTHTTQYVVELP